MTFLVHKFSEYLLVVFVLYLLFVIISGAGFNVFGINWNFENIGQFGDSFGPISATMATIAAISTIATLNMQRKELDQARASAAAESEQITKRDFETTFFNLISLFRQATGDMRSTDPYGQNPTKGREAIKQILNHHMSSRGENFETDAKQYREMYWKYQDELSHYFRIFYHILRYVDGATINDKKLYTRLLRATLSRNEIVIIAFNCMFGGGQQKLKPLLEKYSMLHNISSSMARHWQMDRYFKPSAFGDRSIPEEVEKDEIY